MPQIKRTVKYAFVTLLTIFINFNVHSFYDKCAYILMLTIFLLFLFFRMAEKDYILTFYHNEEFTKDKFLGGTCFNLSELIDADKFSYLVLMEYVVDKLKYTEISRVYVKKVPTGWKLIANDCDLIEYTKTVEGDNLYFYVDNVVDKSIEPMAQMQPNILKVILHVVK